MEKDFEDFIVARCETALLNDQNYLDHGNGNFVAEEVRDIVQSVCYRQGYKDAMKVYLCSQSV